LEGLSVEEIAYLFRSVPEVEVPLLKERGLASYKPADTEAGQRDPNAYPKGRWLDQNHELVVEYRIYFYAAPSIPRPGRVLLRVPRDLVLEKGAITDDYGDYCISTRDKQEVVIQPQDIEIFKIRAWVGIEDS
jgi:hypothetical protein